ncbi:MAG: LCP family protein [Candidatus Daviesbacteria bacterium]|nr:LCP family protein [Candidatus Daviesbacteria bacterium]
MPWKETQSKTQRKKRIKLALIVLLFVIGLVFLSWTVRFTQSLFISSGQRNYHWDGEFNINLAIRTSSISVLSYNPKEEKITILNIPDETFVKVPGGYGSWQLRSVYGLGQAALVKDTLASFLGVPVDGFLDLSSEKSAADFVSMLRENPFSGLKYLSSFKTDLTVWEFLKLKMGISSVRFDKIYEINLGKANILEKNKLPDGTEIFDADPVRLDSVLSDFADPAFIAEHKSIAVFNATDKPQLAQKWARLITNLGGNVIITANAPQRLKNTQVSGEQSQTFKRLKQIFVLDGIINPPDEGVISSRAQINVLLGEDYINK